MIHIKTPRMREALLELLEESFQQLEPSKLSSVAGWRETFGRDLEAKAKLRRSIGKGIERGNRLVPQHFMLAANGSYPGTPLEALLSSLMNIFTI